MIILDTNVLSEVMRPEPAPAVLQWMAIQSADALYVTSISYAEILFGLHMMPESRRQRHLTEQAHRMFLEDFMGHVLDFDMAAAAAYAAIVGTRQQLGHPLDPIDGMIAAIARAHGAAIATRDGDFHDCGVSVINPWYDGRN